MSGLIDVFGLADVVFIVMTVIAIFGTIAGYHNGCVDGYGAAKEPENPGYQSARRYLKKTMSHRWKIE